jgi:hypothetical protein
MIKDKTNRKQRKKTSNRDGSIQRRTRKVFFRLSTCLKKHLKFEPEKEEGPKE